MVSSGDDVPRNPRGRVARVARAGAAARRGLRCGGRRLRGVCGRMPTHRRHHSLGRGRASGEAPPLPDDLSAGSARATAGAQSGRSSHCSGSVPVPIRWAHRWVRCGSVGRLAGAAGSTRLVTRRARERRDPSRPARPQRREGRPEWRARRPPGGALTGHRPVLGSREPVWTRGRPGEGHGRRHARRRAAGGHKAATLLCSPGRAVPSEPTRGVTRRGSGPPAGMDAGGRT
jgi:hypothetical protein